MPDLYVNTLRRAAELVGGEQPLALRLRVTPSHLALWLKGLAVPPGDIFLRAADIVGEHELQTLSKKADAPPTDLN
jgi:DNA-binding transcriptional regulator YdaS (Cro superfamily)